MPQLDPTSFPSQLFWLTVTFLFLYLMLARFVVPRIAGVLETRQGRIDSDLAAAARFREEAEAARAGYEKALQDARAGAQATVAAAQARAAADSASRLQALDQEMNKKLAEAQKAILASRNEAIEKMAPAVADLTAQIVEKITGHKPSGQQIQSALAEAAQGKAV